MGDETVVEDDVTALEDLQTPARDEPRVSRAGPDEEDARFPAPHGSITSGVA
jgi:hypothetical protein